MVDIRHSQLKIYLFEEQWVKLLCLLIFEAMTVSWLVMMNWPDQHEKELGSESLWGCSMCSMCSMWFVVQGGHSGTAAWNDLLSDVDETGRGYQVQLRCRIVLCPTCIEPVNWLRGCILLAILSLFSCVPTWSTRAFCLDLGFRLVETCAFLPWVNFRFCLTRSNHFRLCRCSRLGLVFAVHCTLGMQAGWELTKSEWTAISAHPVVP